MIVPAKIIKNEIYLLTETRFIEPTTYLIFHPYVTKLAFEETDIAGFFCHEDFQRFSILQLHITFLTILELDEKWEFNFIIDRVETEPSE